ncbi:hypoxanthine phosphoribosyltransferase [soil metagenome]
MGSERDELRAREAPASSRRPATPPTPKDPKRAEHFLPDETHLGPVVVDEQALRLRVAELGRAISTDYEGTTPLLICVLKGAFMFLGDLARAITQPVEFDFMAVSSYGSATTPSGVVRIVKDLDIDLTDRHVIIVEDIVDSGLTLSYLRKNLRFRNPASLEVCALLVREGLQTDDPDLRYVGFTIPPDFVVGYGLDLAERYRNLPYIATLLEGADGRTLKPARPRH